MVSTSQRSSILLRIRYTELKTSLRVMLHECVLLESIPFRYGTNKRVDEIWTKARTLSLWFHRSLAGLRLVERCLQLLSAQKLNRSWSIFKIMKPTSAHTTKRFRCALLLPLCAHTWASVIIKIDALWFLSKKPHKSRSPGVSWKIKIALLSDQVLTTFCPIFLLYRRKKVCFGPFFLGFWALPPGPPKIDFLTLF